MIETLMAGECVAKAGAYRTPLRHHHTQAICPAPSISSTGLRMIRTRSAFEFWSFWEGNPNRLVDEPTPALIFGAAAHALLLGDEDWDEGYAVEPSPEQFDGVLVTQEQLSGWLKDRSHRYTGKKPELIARIRDYDTEVPIWDEIVAAFRVRAKGKTVVPYQDYQTIKRMADRLNDHPFVKAGAFHGNVEISLIFPWRVGDVWLKSRIDVMPASGFATDLKTCIDAHPRATFYDIQRHRYDMQMSLGSWAAREVFGIPRTECSLLFIQKKEPFSIHHKVIDSETIGKAEIECRNAVKTFEKCLASGDWPDFEEDTYYMPARDAEAVFEETT